MLLLRFLSRNNHHHHCCLLTAKTKFLVDFRFLQYPSLKFYSNVSKPTTQSSITKDYLVNVCGLSPKAALTAARMVRFSSTERPNSVLGLFQSNGFSKTQITKIISKHPSLLVADPEKILKPKIDFFQDLGFSGPQLTKLISTDPTVLRRGLKSHLIPSVEYLKSLLNSDEEVCIVFSKSILIFRYSLEKVIGPNVDILRSVGIPRSNILKMLLLKPGVLLTKTKWFNEVVTVVKEMGFSPYSMMFIHAVRVMAGMNNKSWKGKVSLYKELGWSEEEFMYMFRNQPTCMTLSDEKIKQAVNFFMNELKWTVSHLCSCSTLLFLSLEKRVIPRCSVLGVLHSKGVLKRLSVKWALYMNDKKFWEKYVVGYQKRIPEVLKAYEGKIGFTGFGEVDLLKEL